MLKKFDIWNEKKKKLEDLPRGKYFYEREIWMCSLGENVGFEQSGQGNDFLRPMLIIKKFNPNIFWGLPLTKTQKKGKYYYSFSFKKDVVSTVVLSQIKLIDVKRLQYRKGILDKITFKKLAKKLRDIFPE